MRGGVRGARAPASLGRGRPPRRLLRRVRPRLRAHALALLVLRHLIAHHVQTPLTLDDLARLAQTLDRGSNLMWSGGGTVSAGWVRRQAFAHSFRVPARERPPRRARVGRARPFVRSSVRAYLHDDEARGRARRASTLWRGPSPAPARHRRLARSTSVTAGGAARGSTRFENRSAPRAPSSSALDEKHHDARSGGIKVGVPPRGGPTGPRAARRAGRRPLGIHAQEPP